MCIYSIQFQSHCNTLSYPTGSKTGAFLASLRTATVQGLSYIKNMQVASHFSTISQLQSWEVWSKNKKVPRSPKTNQSFMFVFSSEDQQIPTDLGQDNSMDKKLLFYPFSEPVFPTFHIPTLSQFLICGDLRKFLNGLIKIKFWNHKTSKIFFSSGSYNTISFQMAHFRLHFWYGALL